VVRKVARGQKTNPETIYKIMTAWSVSQNVSAVARDFNMADSTVRKIVEDNKDKPEFKKLCDEKREEFSKMASRLIEKAARRLEMTLDDEGKDIPANHLTTVIGTLYDKKALADGNATDNVAVSIKLPEGIDEYAG
jgi:hypothetical protein